MKTYYLFNRYVVTRKKESGQLLCLYANNVDYTASRESLLLPTTTSHFPGLKKKKDFSLRSDHYVVVIEGSTLQEPSLRFKRTSTYVNFFTA